MTTREILLVSAVTQSTESVVSLLKYLGKPIDSLPQIVDLRGVILVLNNKQDAFYVTTATSCSCPAACYRPGQRCKHQRKHFPQGDKPVSMASVEILPLAGKWAGGFNGPVDPESIKARVGSEKGA